MSIRKTAAAMKDQAEVDPILSGSTFQGVVLNRPNRYMTFFLSGGPRKQSRLTGPSSVYDYVVVTHSVGTTPEQAQLVEERTQKQFVDWRPNLDGFDCRRMQLSDSQPIELDRDVNPPLYYIASTYGLTMEETN